MGNQMAPAAIANSSEHRGPEADFDPTVASTPDFGAAAETWFPRWLAATTRNMTTGILPWMRYRSQRPLTIVVLGMHRSGTSCIARMINLCGASVGDSVAAANWSNKAGHWEPLESIVVNDALLRLSGGAWNVPPSRLELDVRFRWRMKGFLGRLHDEGTAVWKDPRTVLTFPLWKPLLCRYRVVAAFRNPLSVAESLRRREANFPLERGLALWKAYNERLLALTADEPDPLWIDFDGGIDHVVSRIRQLANECDLEYRDEIAQSYSPELRTSDAQGRELDASVRETYAKLQALAL